MQISVFITTTISVAIKTFKTHIFEDVLLSTRRPHGRRIMNLFRKLKLSCACSNSGIGLKCDGTRAETRFRLPAKRTSPFKSAGASVQSITGSRGVRICGSNGSNAAYTMFRGIVKGTGYPLHPPVSPSLPLPCVTVCHHISNGLYFTPHTPHLKQGDSETTLSPDLPAHASYAQQLLPVNVSNRADQCQIS